jgi:hypothetical protein
MHDLSLIYKSMLPYSEFLLEKLLLNESILQYSLGFNKIVSRINLPIAKNVLSLNRKDVQSFQNYIDILPNEDDMVTFILDKKASEILGEEPTQYKVVEEERYLVKSDKNKHIFNKLGINIEEDYFTAPEIGDIGKILKECVSSASGKTFAIFEYTESEDENKVGKKSILNMDCLTPSNDTSKLWTSNRNKIKIGRFIRSILKSNEIKFTDKEIEEFVNSYKSEIELLNNAFMKFDIVEGDMISKFYDYNTYQSQSGTLGNSCMKNKPDKYFEIYTKNPDSIKLVILYDDNGVIENKIYKSSKIVGRALLWKTDNGDEVLDRIYTIHDKDVELFKKFSDSKNWWHKKSQNSQCEDFIAERKEEIKSEKFLISLFK